MQSDIPEIAQHELRVWDYFMLVILGQHACKKGQTAQITLATNFKKILMQDLKIGDVFMQLPVPIMVYNSHSVKGFDTDAWCIVELGCYAAKRILRTETSSATKVGAGDGRWDFLMASKETNWTPMLFLPPGDRATVKCTA